MKRNTKEAPRSWTEPEKQKLYRDYFARDAGVCPVCAAGVHVVMEHAGEVPILYLWCDCGNRARVWAGQDI